MQHDNILQEQIAKKAAGYYAADLITDGMVVGLGTGSTAAYFIEKLIIRCREGLKIQAVATSTHSEKQARDGNIPIVNINQLSSIDITADGADEIDVQKQMIKGGGGALLREKIIASMSREMVVIVDEKKLVNQLGKFPLPVEIVPFAYTTTIRRIHDLGLQGKLRYKNQNDIFVTDNGNYIYDIHFQRFIEHPDKLNHQLKEVVGVVETGLFINIAGRVVIGYSNGSVKIRS